ncbi:hypothetical protein RHS01_02472 [Rhizoctonia solani]|uniref:Uncharacterized protein n=1 Tax=Rhizoctonia solani TaxID=456999 RepID=A0A8H7IJU1_9AGAM|nr:hypothetical protein RHS01_02472 [Rhizoctonia solani]
MSKSKQQEAQDLLNDLDSLGAPPQSIGRALERQSLPLHPLPNLLNESACLLQATLAVVSTHRAQELQYLSLASTATPPPNASTSQTATTEENAPAVSAGSWGWGSVWNSASAALQQARTVVEEQAKHLPLFRQPLLLAGTGQEMGRGHDGVCQDLRNVSLSTLTEIMNVVAPPISEHEVIQVWLSHDMQGYDGIESLIMDQVEGGDLTVNRGNETRQKEGSTDRELNALHSYEEAIKLAEAEIAEMVKVRAAQPTTSEPKSPTLQNPTTYSTVYIRVQPFFSPELPTKIPSLPGAENPAVPPTPKAEQQQLQFLLYLVDPAMNWRTPL